MAFDAPIGYTPHLNLKLFGDHADPGADQQNENLTKLDQAVFDAKANVSVVDPIKKDSNGQLSLDFNTANMKVSSGQLNTAQDIYPTADVTFNKVTATSRLNVGDGLITGVNNQLQLVSDTKVDGQLNVTDYLVAENDVTVKTAIKSDNFVQGISGFKIDEPTGTAEFQNVIVNGTLTTTTLKKNVIQVVNGKTFITDKYANVGLESTDSLIILYDGNNAIFEVGDMLYYQSQNGSNVYTVKATVTSVDWYTIDDGTDFSRYYLSFTQGNYSSFKKGNVIVTVNDGCTIISDAGIEVYDSITSWNQFLTSAKLLNRIGDLNGIVSAFGTLSGKGSYSKGNTYIEGLLNVLAGSKIGNWVTDIDSIKSGIVKVQANSTFAGLDVNGRVKVGDFSYSTMPNSTNGTNMLHFGDEVTITDVNLGTDNGWNVNGIVELSDGSTATPLLSYYNNEQTRTSAVYTDPGVGVASWDYVLRRKTNDNSLLLGKTNKLKFKAQIYDNGEYRTKGGTFNVMIDYYNASGTKIYQQVLYTQAIADKADISSPDPAPIDFMTNGLTFSLPYVDNVSKIYFSFNWQGGQQGGSYDVMCMQLTYFRIEGYTAYYTYVTDDGIDIYNSPTEYISFAKGKSEISSANLLSNGVRVARCHGTLASAPTSNIQVGDSYINSSTLNEFVCVKLPVSKDALAIWKQRT